MEAEKGGPRGMQKAWGCRVGNHEPVRKLPSHLEAVERAASSILGIEPCGGCVFEGVFSQTDSWMPELFTALRLVKEDKLPWVDALGRDLTAVDVDALGAVSRTRAKIERIEDERRREKLKRAAEEDE